MCQVGKGGEEERRESQPSLSMDRLTQEFDVLIDVSVVGTWRVVGVNPGYKCIIVVVDP